MAVYHEQLLCWRLRLRHGRRLHRLFELLERPTQRHRLLQRNSPPLLRVLLSPTLLDLNPQSGRLRLCRCCMRLLLLRLTPRLRCRTARGAHVIEGPLPGVGRSNKRRSRPSSSTSSTTRLDHGTAHPQPSCLCGLNEPVALTLLLLLSPPDTEVAPWRGGRYLPCFHQLIAEAYHTTRWGRRLYASRCAHHRNPLPYSRSRL